MHTQPALLSYTIATIMRFYAECNTGAAHKVTTVRRFGLECKVQIPRENCQAMCGISARCWLDVVHRTAGNCVCLQALFTREQLSRITRVVSLKTKQSNTFNYQIIWRVKVPGQRRIIIFPTVLNNFSRPEIQFVLYPIKMFYT